MEQAVVSADHGDSHIVKVSHEELLEWLIEDEYSSVTDDYKFQAQWIYNVLANGHPPLKDCTPAQLVEEYKVRYLGYDFRYEVDKFGILPCFKDGNQGQVIHIHDLVDTEGTITFSWYEEKECPEEEA